MHWNNQGKKILRKPFLPKHQKCFDTDLDVFQKKETECYLNMNLKKVLQMWIMCEWGSKLPQNSIFL